MFKKYNFKTAARRSRIFNFFILFAIAAGFTLLAFYPFTSQTAARQTGVLQICKVLSGSGLENRVFGFKIGSITVEVVAGQCSAPIIVPSGTNRIEELLTGRTTTGGTFSGGFQLTGVTTLGQTPPSALLAVDLSSRTADVNIQPGDTSNQTRIQFTNSPGVSPTPTPSPTPIQNGVLQICKTASGAGLENRIFKFQIGDFITEVIAGQCSAPIVITAGPTVIEELADGRLTTGGTFSGGFQLSGVTTLGSTSPSVITAVNLPARTANVNIPPGGIAIETRIQFTNSATTTPPGPNIHVEPNVNLDLIFENVSTAGDTIATAIAPEQIQPLPASVFLFSSSLAYEITTTAVFSDNITVSFNVPNVADASTCNQLRILHFVNNAWDSSGNKTPVYNSGNQTCAVSQIVTTLSPFVVAQFIDTDYDGVADTADNCSLTPNADQADTDGDGDGNVCDSDDDNDGVADAADNCPLTFNPDQADFDRDGIGDTCDPKTGPPVDKKQCKNGGWMRFDFPSRFKNEGDCIKFVNTGN